MKILKRLFGAFLSGGMLLGILYLSWAYVYQGPSMGFGAYLGSLVLIFSVLTGGVLIFLYGLTLLFTGK